jgi:hypothetical protein
MGSKHPLNSATHRVVVGANHDLLLAVSEYVRHVGVEMSILVALPLALQ